MCHGLFALAFLIWNLYLPVCHTLSIVQLQRNCNSLVSQLWASRGENKKRKTNETQPKMYPHKKNTYFLYSVIRDTNSIQTNIRAPCLLFSVYGCVLLYSVVCFLLFNKNWNWSIENRTKAKAFTKKLKCHPKHVLDRMWYDPCTILIIDGQPPQYMHSWHFSECAHAKKKYASNVRTAKK